MFSRWAPNSPQPPPMPARALELGPCDAPGARSAPRAGLASQVASLAQPDLQKDQAGGQDEPETDQHDGEHLSETSAHEHGAERPDDHECSRRAEAEDSRARRHGDVKPWTVGL